jgi:phytoene dehydrogenase-like protein
VKCRGGAVVVFLGIPEDEVADHSLTHHQFLHEPGRPLVDGNNMFVSVSAANDRMSAPSGHRAVMISTHTNLETWQGLGPAGYQDAKDAITRKLIERARRIYPRLGDHAVVVESGTPLTYQHFTGRPDGAVGGYRLHAGNANQRAIPQDIGVPGFWLAGDTTWPGLGTVACAISSRIAAECVAGHARTLWRAAVERDREQWGTHALLAPATVSRASRPEYSIAPNAETHLSPLVRRRRAASLTS